MAEALSRQLEKARVEKSIPGIKITRGAQRINHSQFVDDTLLLGGASPIIAKRFKEILEEFMRALGGKITNRKSKSMYGI
jgi:hypothetical protein